MKQQRGTTLVLTALALTVLLGSAALVVNLSLISLASQQAQDAADAAALAGGALLPDSDTAVTAAQQIVTANNGQGNSFTLDGATTLPITDGSGNAFSVQGHVNVPTVFGSTNTTSVTAQATAALQTACGLPPGVGIAPFGLIGDAPNSADTTAQYVATLLSTASGAQTPQPGVYQPTTTFGGQPLVLRQNVWSNGTLVLTGNFDPLQMPDSTNYESSVFSVSSTALAASQTLSPQSSATVSLSQSGLSARLAPSNTQFTHTDTLSPAYVNWFFGNPNYPIDTSRPPVTDPNTGITYSYYADPNRQKLTDGHVLILPIISQSTPNGTGPVTILAFTAFFVEEPESSKTSNAIAQGRFIGLILPSASSGVCTAAGVNMPPVLVQ